jgi:hypothetical protein
MQPLQRVMRCGGWWMWRGLLGCGPDPKTATPLPAVTGGGVIAHLR